MTPRDEAKIILQRIAARHEEIGSLKRAIEAKQEEIAELEAELLGKVPDE